MNLDNLKNKVNNDFIKGGIAGITGLTLSHPIDTIKNNIQAGTPIKLNFRSLYSGFGAPLGGIAFEKASVFTIQKKMHSILKNDHDPIFVNAVSGGTAGVVVSGIVAPYEHIKIRLQTQQKLTKQILHPKQLFKEMLLTSTREGPGYAIYFTTFDLIKKKFYNNEYNLMGSFIGGGISGATSWLFIAAQDTVKTRYQSGVNGNKSIWWIIKDIHGQHGRTGIRGLMNFYKAFPQILARAIPLHAGSFAMYQFLQQY